jgi:hypothetical protein
MWSIFQYSAWEISSNRIFYTWKIFQQRGRWWWGGCGGDEKKDGGGEGGSDGGKMKVVVEIIG